MTISKADLLSKGVARPRVHGSVDCTIKANVRMTAPKGPAILEGLFPVTLTVNDCSFQASGSTPTEGVRLSGELQFTGGIHAVSPEEMRDGYRVLTIRPRSPTLPSYRLYMTTEELEKLHRFLSA